MILLKEIFAFPTFLKKINQAQDIHLTKSTQWFVSSEPPEIF